MSDSLLIDPIKNIVIIKINNEKNLNALNLNIIRDLRKELEDIDNDDEKRVVILTGTGNTSFCTGADLDDFKDLGQENIVNWCVDGSTMLFNYIPVMKKPVIAAVNGYAMGGGFEFALSCDLRVASENALFSMPEYNLGWVPGWGGIKRLGSLVGESKAKEIIMLKKKIDAHKAKELGIVYEVTSKENLLEKCIEIGKRMAQLNPMTIAITKAVLDETYMDQKQSYLEGLAVSLLSKTRYAREKIRKFEERNK